MKVISFGLYVVAHKHIYTQYRKIRLAHGFLRI